MYGISEDTELWVSQLSDVHDEALRTMGQTLFVCVILVTFSLLFKRDAEKIVINPINKIMETVRRISANPLTAITAHDDDNDDDTSMVHATVTKMARLLQVGFGTAGATI